MIASFDNEPPIGTTIRLDEQLYTLVETEPYRRKDGEMTRLLTWHTTCAQCDMPFTCQSGLKIASLNRRCIKHKRPGQRVKKRPKREPLAITIGFPS